MSDTYGRMSRWLLAYFDPASSCWRTLQGTLLSADPPSLDRLPPWGMTRGGELFELPTPAHLTAGRDSSSLPTPTASMTTGPGSQGRGGGLNLQTAIAENTNSTVGDERGLAAPGEAQSGRARADAGGSGGVGTVNLLPTPVVNDMGNGKTPPNGTGGPLT